MNGHMTCRAKMNDLAEPLDISGYAGICLEVRTKQNYKYRFGLHDKGNEDVVSWEASFESPISPEDSIYWSQINVPFTNFIYQGAQQAGKQLDLKTIHSFSMSICKSDNSQSGDSGNFSLEMKDIRAYGQRNLDVIESEF